MCMACFVAKLIPAVPVLAMALGYGFRVLKRKHTLFTSDGRVMLGQLK